MATDAEWRDAIGLKDLAAASKTLPESYYARPATEVARDLLGKVIVHGSTAGLIVEVEAYLGIDDLAAHAAAGITGRTRVLFGPPGRAYVYLIYGVHECLNLVAEPDGVAGCVLIRALEPLCGVEQMKQRRGAARRRRDLCSGPGKLTAAMGITLALNGVRVTSGGALAVWEWTDSPEVEIATSTRIGITKCMDWPLRFYAAGNAFVSR
jgi:DNA-3-methyladenine glycosylase